MSEDMPTGSTLTDFLSQHYGEVYYAEQIISAIGAFFIAHLVFRKFWKSNVTKTKLAGFTLTYVVAYMIIIFVLSMIVDRHVDFGR